MKSIRIFGDTSKVVESPPPVVIEYMDKDIVVSAVMLSFFSACMDCVFLYWVGGGRGSITDVVCFLLGSGGALEDCGVGRGALSFLWLIIQSIFHKFVVSAKRNFSLVTK